MDNILFLCPECKKEFAVECPVEFEDGEPVIKVGMFDDVCPDCGIQADQSDIVYVKCRDSI